MIHPDKVAHDIRALRGAWTCRRLDPPSNRGEARQRGKQVRQDGALFLRWQPSKERQDCLEGLGDLINVRHAP